MNIFRKLKYRNALLITFFYLLFGIIFFLLNDIYITSNDNYKFHLLELQQNLAFLIVSTILFFFLVYYSTRKTESSRNDISSLRNSLFNSSYLVVVSDSKGKIKEVNQKFIRLSGFMPNDVIGKNLTDYSDLAKEKFQKIFENLKSRNENFAEFSFRKQNGSRYHELATIITLEDKKTNTIEYLKISSDISYLKEQEEQLINEKTKVENLNNAKIQFISRLSQEIRSPMSGIIGMTELMMLTDLNDKQKEYLEIINFSSGTLLAIINDILDFSRIETGKLKLEKINYDLKELINKTVQVLDLDARKKNISMKLDFDEKLNYKISGDPLRLNQVILNILKNSIMLTDKGVIEIKVFQKPGKNAKTNLAFEISDPGSPVPEKIIKEMNFGNETPLITSDFEYKGLGLGFTIVKHILMLMNGKITINAVENTGNKILVEIPFESAESVVENNRYAPEEKRDLAEIDKTREISILVAEDNFVNQRLVKELLSRRNYSVDIVDNGLKIFDLLEEKKFDIILMDIQMPVMDGLEATSIIREIEKGTGKHTPIIGITAYSVIADRDKCLEAGMDDYLQKPFIKEEFYTMIDRYTSKK
jgi:PAS domain S-box-containing protein